MSEFEEKLNAILSDPNAMAQVASLAQSLHLGDPPASGADTGSSAAPPPVSPGSGAGDPTGLGDLLGQLDPSMLARLLPLLRELTHPAANDQRMALLMALRPFLRPERRDKVEQAARAARLLHLGKRFLTAGGDDHV